MPRFEQDFAGIPDVPHVADPERPFAAMMSAITGFSVEAIQRALEEGGTPRPDEHLGNIRIEGRNEGGEEAVSVRPLPLQGAVGPEGILERIMGQLDEGDAVALYHREDDGRNSPHKWLLLAGGRVNEDGNPIVVQAIDPKRLHKNYFARHNMISMIERATRDERRPRGLARVTSKVVDYLTGADLDPKPDAGIYAFAVTEHIYRPLRLIFEDEPEETEPPQAVIDANAASREQSMAAESADLTGPDASA